MTSSKLIAAINLMHSALEIDDYPLYESAHAAIADACSHDGSLLVAMTDIFDYAIAYARLND